LFCVFGCGGDRDRGKRPLMARVAQDHADVVIVTDDNPRHESPVQIAAEIVAGFTRLRDVPIIHDRAQAIRVAIRQAQSGDVVLIAGKGHEAYQQIGEQRVPFSDGEQVRCCLMRDK
jgi:UDP-N-acetylmuramoyl-L-alanyl-D-glutamate--2,6-diaminopimelate ligase